MEFKLNTNKLPLDSKWILRFLYLADHVSTWSKDPSSKIGAVIARDKNIISVGYNGFPPQIADTAKRLTNRNSKYLRTIHAELNAIKFARGNTEGAAIYCNVPPCHDCAKHIISHNIKYVYAWEPSEDLKQRWQESFATSEVLFEEAGVEYFIVERNK